MVAYRRSINYDRNSIGATKLYKTWLDPSLNLRIEHHTFSNLHGSELRDYWYNVARDPDNLRFLRYRNSTGKVVIRNGKLYGIYLDIETEITCHNAHFISSSTAGYTQQATFKAFVNGGACSDSFS